MKKYRILFALAMFLLCFQPYFAQPHREKVEALRVSFITQKLELSASESEKFWPVYNEYHTKLSALKKNMRQSFRKLSANMNESDAEKLYYLDLQTKQAEADLYKLYTEKIRTIIGTTKSVKLKIAEAEFKREVLESIRDKHEH